MKKVILIGNLGRVHDPIAGAGGMSFEPNKIVCSIYRMLRRTGFHDMDSDTDMTLYDRKLINKDGVEKYTAEIYAEDMHLGITFRDVSDDVPFYIEDVQECHGARPPPAEQVLQGPSM